MDEKVTFKGRQMTLSEAAIKEGSKAPDFKVVNFDLKEVGLADFTGKIKVITTFLSLDTPVCDLQVKEFNKEAVGFSADVVVIGISKDLPFAQKRFCQINEIKNAVVLSDYKFDSFGKQYGLLVEELNLLARAVLILDKDNIIRYIQIVGELTSPPNYGEVLKRLAVVVK